MKRFIAFLISLTMLALCGCGGNNAEPSSVPSAEETAEESSAEEAPEYAIVFYRFYADEADRMAAKVKELTGKEIRVIEYDQNSQMPAHAVYIGEVTDGVGSELSKASRGMDYGIKPQNGSVYIYGGSRDAVTKAAEYFMSEFITENGVNTDTEYVYTHDYPLAGASVCGVPLSEYTVVYSATTNEAKYSDVANEIKQYLKENADRSPTVAPATRAETEYELLLGSETGRQAGKGLYESKFEYDAYRIIIDGTKIAIVGGNACAVWHGFLALCGAVAENGGNIGETTIDGRCRLVKVACVGGSITEGSNSKDPDKTYPIFLQKMLGFDYLVKNFGIGGYSVVSTDVHAYTKHWKYTSSVKFVPDVVIWMLGINDGNPSQDFKEWEGTNRREKYIQSAEMMFSAYEKVNPDVQIFVTLPSSLFKSNVWTEWKEWGARVEKYVIPLNRELAEKHGYPVIDVFTWANDHPEVFPDGLHPEDDAYKTYAKRVYDEIYGVIKTPEDLG